MLAVILFSQREKCFLHVSVIPQQLKAVFVHGLRTIASEKPTGILASV
jgi:hypothetical protein